MPHFLTPLHNWFLAILALNRILTPCKLILDMVAGTYCVFPASLLVEYMLYLGIKSDVLPELDNIKEVMT